MKITTPHLGNSYIAMKVLFDGLKIPFIVPKISSEKTLEVGAKYSPEEICLPYKIMLGNLINSIEAGADTILITGSCGPCRYGEYCELFINTFKNMNYNVDIIVLDRIEGIGKEQLLSRIDKISKASNLAKVKKMKAIYNSYKVIKLMDNIEARCRYLAGFEINKGECKKLIANCKKEIVRNDNPQEVISILNYNKKLINKIAVNMNKNPIKIAIIGEIYTILEPFANLYIEDKLMDLGVSVTKAITPSWWMKNTILEPLGLNSIKIKKASNEYLSWYIGGHGRECIGEAVIASKENYDCAIQILPLGCMPEIVAKSILPQISKEKDFPIMSLVVDEMTGKGGFYTRIEAFVDLLERRKQLCIM